LQKEGDREIRGEKKGDIEREVVQKKG